MKFSLSSKWHNITIKYKGKILKAPFWIEYQIKQKFDHFAVLHEINWILLMLLNDVSNTMIWQYGIDYQHGLTAQPIRSTVVHFKDQSQEKICAFHVYYKGCSFGNLLLHFITQVSVYLCTIYHEIVNQGTNKRNTVHL